MSEPLIDRLEVFASFHTSRVRYRDVEPFSDYDDLMSMVEEVKALKDRVEKAQDWLKPYWDDLIEDTDNYRVRVLNRADFAKLEKAVGGSST